MNELDQAVPATATIAGSPAEREHPTVEVTGSDLNGSELEQTAGPEQPRQEGQNWKLTLAYDGSEYCGWQVQPGLRTVQGTLAHTLERIVGERVLPQGSGRTDTGVHALGQVASFRLQARIPAHNLLRALNHRLPPSIRAMAVESMPPEFHARHSSRAKLYEYRIWRGEICPPWIAPYVHACNWPLDIAAMQQAAPCILGEHDFTSFAATQPDQGERLGTTPVHPAAARVNPMGVDSRGNRRYVEISEWTQPGPDLLVYRVQGSGFLHHMVRNLVGTFFAVGRGLLSPEAVPAVIEARSRDAAHSTAPAHGLFLVSVEYGERVYGVSLAQAPA